MAERRWVPLTFIVPFGVLAWLAARQGSTLTWVILGAWGVLVLAVILRALRPDARGHRTRVALGPAADGFETVQGIYLGRPSIGAVTYGTDGPPDVTLVDDRPDPDPGDLREADRPA